MHVRSCIGIFRDWKTWQLLLYDVQNASYCETVGVFAKWVFHCLITNADTQTLSLWHSTIAWFSGWYPRTNLTYLWISPRLKGLSVKKSMIRLTMLTAAFRVPVHPNKPMTWALGWAFLALISSCVHWYPVKSFSGEKVWMKLNTDVSSYDRFWMVQDVSHGDDQTCGSN